MRLFAAIELSDEMKKALVRFQDSLKDAGVFYDGEGLPEVSIDPVEMTTSYISLMRSDRGKSGMIYSSVGEIYADGYE